jgi:hypothetical protein
MLMSLPALAVGFVPVAGEVAVLGLRPSLFEWYSKKSAASVEGIIGAHAISRFRVEADFPGQTSCWLPGDIRVLRLERAGKPRVVKAAVMRLP